MVDCILGCGAGVGAGVGDVVVEYILSLEVVKGVEGVICRGPRDWETWVG
jgi:hypothetical protein